MYSLKVKYAFLLLGLSLFSNSQTLRETLVKNLWSFSKPMRQLQHLDTFELQKAQLFINSDIIKFGKKDILYKCYEVPFSSSKKKKKSNGFKCEWKKIGLWASNGSKLSFDIDSFTVYVDKTIILEDRIKFIVRSVLPK